MHTEHVGAGLRGHGGIRIKEARGVRSGFSWIPDKFIDSSLL